MVYNLGFFFEIKGKDALDMLKICNEFGLDVLLKRRSLFFTYLQEPAMEIPLVHACTHSEHN